MIYDMYELNTSQKMAYLIANKCIECVREDCLYLIFVRLQKGNIEICLEGSSLWNVGLLCNVRHIVSQYSGDYQYYICILPNLGVSKTIVLKLYPF